jgi:hypothetical protein
MRRKLTLVLALAIPVALIGVSTPKVEAFPLRFGGYRYPAYPVYRAPIYGSDPPYYRSVGVPYIQHPYPAANLPLLQQPPRPSVYIPQYPAFQEPSFYELPAQLRYLRVGTIVQAPGHAFDLEVVPFQNRKVLVPVTGAGGDGSGDSGN